jgi:hypothetical protein
VSLPFQSLVSAVEKAEGSPNRKVGPGSSSAGPSDARHENVSPAPATQAPETLGTHDATDPTPAKNGTTQKVPVSKQNISSAVMQQRKEPHDSLDFFPTPAWATRALCEHVLGGGKSLGHCSVWEPACGEGHMARPLAEYFGLVHSSDIHDYGFGPTEDFLQLAPQVGLSFDWIITNPPFRLAEQFVRRARLIAGKGVAVLVRTAFLEGIARWNELFRDKPPDIVAQFVERVAMVKGRVDPDAASATAYCWLVWRYGNDWTRLQWIPPCRKKLERPSDYIENDGPLSYELAISELRKRGLREGRFEPITDQEQDYVRREG